MKSINVFTRLHKFVSLSLLLTTIAFVSSCNQEDDRGEGYQEDTTPVVIVYSVEGSGGTIEGRNNRNNKYIPFASNSSIAGATTLVFEAKVSGNKKVNKWKINGKEQNGEKDAWFHYYVNPADAVNGEINITVSFTVAPKIVIKYKSENSGGTLTAANGSSSLNSGDSVYETRRIGFSVKLDKGRKVAKWKVNGKTWEGYEGNNFNYTANSDDIVNGAITITVEFTDAQSFKINYSMVGTTGGIIVGEESTSSGGHVAFTSGASIYETQDIYFYVKPKEGEKVVEWKINGKPVKQMVNNKLELYGPRKSFWYFIKPADAINGEINITVNITTASKLIVKYSGGGITQAEKKISGNYVAFASGDSIYETTRVRLTGSVPTGKKTVWKINGVTQNDDIGVEDFYYTVKASDAVNGEIHLTLEFTDAQAIAIKYYVEGGSGGTLEGQGVSDGGNLYNGKPVYETRTVYFRSSPNVGKKTIWKLNGVTQSGYGVNTAFKYRVKASDAVNGEIRITVQFIDAPKIVINYNVVGGGGTLTATNGSSSLTSGDSVYEEVQLRFEAIPTDSSKKPVWKMNGNDWKDDEGHNSRLVYYTIRSSDAVNGAIHLTVSFE